MHRVLLIGYGNTLRGDDALGPMAVERLRGHLPGVEFVSCHQLTPELAAQLAVCELAIFVDASVEGEPGTVRAQALAAVSDPTADLTHHLTPSALLELTRELYIHAPEALLITGTGSDFESGEGLSAAAHAALVEICRMIPPRLHQTK